MAIDRRHFLRLAGAATLAPVLPTSAPAAPSGTAGGRLGAGPPAIADLDTAGGARQPWPGYERALVVDALASPGAFNVPDAVEGGLGTLSLGAAGASGITAVNVTVGVVGEEPEPFVATVTGIARWEREVDRHPDLFARIRTAEDVRAAKAGGRVGLVLGFQDTVMLEADLDRMDTFHALGVRVVQLTYNGRNRVGDGCLEPGNAGLSRFGHDLVSRMNDLGVLVDLSHCGQRTTAEGIAASRVPPAVTHSACDAVFAHPRNKRDEELRALAEKGGVVGIYLMPYLNPSGPPTGDDVLRHVEHALDVCGQDHVGVGSDQSITPVLDGPEYRARLDAEVARRRELGISAPREDTAPFVAELNHARRMEMIADRMAARGHASRVIEKVLGVNWMRVFTEVWR
jgi:membrane dipeptidase